MLWYLGSFLMSFCEQRREKPMKICQQVLFCQYQHWLVYSLRYTLAETCQRTYLVTREDQRVGNNDVLPPASSEDDDLSDIIWR